MSPLSPPKADKVPIGCAAKNGIILPLLRIVEILHTLVGRFAGVYDMLTLTY
jgi:hypothetical protein